MEFDIARQIARFTAGSDDPRDVAGRVLEGIASAPDEAIFVLTTARRAADEAAASATRYQDGHDIGLLDGVPIAWKDLFDLKGEVTRAGSHTLGNTPSEEDALLVHRLAQAGAVTVGKLNLTEFAFSVLGLNPHFGTPRNPWSDEPRVPGGSSSGCGTAVARGLVPIAVGTDTSGSIRVPAAFNGVVGFKPSSQRWPLDGCFPLSETLDTAGVICGTLSDAIVVDAAARGIRAPELRRGTIQGVHIVVPSNAVWDGTETAVRMNAEAALVRLADAGAKVEHRAIPTLDAVLALNERYGTLVTLEAYRLHAHRLATDAACIDRQVFARMIRGADIDAEAEAAIRAARLCLTAELEALFDGGTLLAFPTVPHVAPLLVPLETDDALFAATNMRTMRNTALGNFLDWCSVSIPSGSDQRGLPTALMLSSGPGRDNHLLAAALAAEPLIRPALNH
ncbi:amidase family protein [Glacieibacterium megasporae]|uniref:amidase family protein n=1 Tax=Glacieibacterium megasporae TaxID=2835787 RepID=UPI001C1DFA01|nr:amidase family protein [Polymorphobacter megasporae]UAJ11010.1 amidase [Polymorphobacter megasporae]